MTFPGKFTEHLIADKLDRISLSFLVDGLEIRQGGVAANIAFGMGCLGLRPLLVGAVGQDFATYRSWLEAHGVDTSAVLESKRSHTARFVCTTDTDGNQIASFYPGAMSEARDISITDVAGRTRGVDLVLIGADDPDAMFPAHGGLCRRGGSRSLRTLPAAPREWTPTRPGRWSTGRRTCSPTSTSWPSSSSGPAGTPTSWSSTSRSWSPRFAPMASASTQAGQPPVTVGAVPGIEATDPTGAGDAFRAGFLAAVACWLSLERAAQLGCLVAASALETVGTQEYQLTAAALTDRFAAADGRAAAAEIAQHLS